MNSQWKFVEHIGTKLRLSNSNKTNNSPTKIFATMKFAALFCIIVIVSSSCLCDATGELPANRVRRSFDDMVKVKAVFSRWKFHSDLWFEFFCLAIFKFVQAIQKNVQDSNLSNIRKFLLFHQNVFVGFSLRLLEY